MVDAVNALVAELEPATTMQQVHEIVAWHYVHFAVQIIDALRPELVHGMAIKYQQAIAEQGRGYTAAELQERLTGTQYAVAKALYVAGQRQAEVAQQHKPQPWSVKTVQKHVDDAAKRLSLEGGAADLRRIFHYAHRPAEER
ncbi:MAG: hypothetical protein HY855_17815 [Burkholderiales bacterium]|nr:hypothetical protein [Burkholderiales bacterium]